MQKEKNAPDVATTLPKKGRMGKKAAAKSYVTGGGQR